MIITFIYAFEYNLGHLELLSLQQGRNTGEYTIENTVILCLLRIGGKESSTSLQVTMLFDYGKAMTLLRSILIQFKPKNLKEET